MNPAPLALVSFRRKECEFTGLMMLPKAYSDPKEGAGFLQESKAYVSERFSPETQVGIRRM